MNVLSDTTYPFNPPQVRTGLVPRLGINHLFSKHLIHLQMAISPELKAKLDLALLAQGKTVQENRDKSLSSVTSRKLDWNVDADVNIFLAFQAGDKAYIDRDAIEKQPDMHKTVYATVTGFHSSDKPAITKTDDKGETYRNRVLYVDIAGGGSTMMFFNAYDSDFPEGKIAKGTVITTKAIPFAAGSQVINKAKAVDGVDMYNLAIYSRDAWYAFNRFGHATSAQELTVATSAKQLKTVLAEIEL